MAPDVLKIMFAFQAKAATASPQGFIAFGVRRSIVSARAIIDADTVVSTAYESGPSRDHSAFAQQGFHRLFH